MPVKMWNKVTASIPGAGNEVAVAHGLGVVPTFVCLLRETHADITIGSTAPNATNIYLDNANVGAQNATVLVFKPHSLIDG